jgi:hypothetical protein
MFGADRTLDEYGDVFNGFTEDEQIYVDKPAEQLLNWAFHRLITIPFNGANADDQHTESYALLCLIVNIKDFERSSDDEHYGNMCASLRELSNFYNR